MVVDPQNTVRIVGIDPGSSLGTAILHVDIATRQLVMVEAQTFIGRKMYNPEGWTATLNGERQARLRAHRDNILSLLMFVEPLQIVCESPFYSQRMPSAFGSLTETVDMIRSAVESYSPWRSLHLIDPPSVKKSVGAAGNADKVAMRLKVIEKFKAFYDPSSRIPIEALDEHSIDAIAIAYSRLVGIQNNVF